MSQESGSHPQAELSRDLGLVSAMAIGVGTMIAAGIFTLSGLAVRNVGSAAIASFLMAAVVALFTALSYCEFAALYPHSGEGYLYARKTFPKTLAWFVGFCLFLGYTSSCAFYIASLSTYFQEFVYHLSWPLLSGALSLVILTLLNMKGTKESGSFQVVVTIGKVLLLIWFVIGGMKYVDMAQVVDSFSTDLVKIGSTSAMVFITFFGFSAIAASAGEVKDPVKTIPNAIFWSMGIVTVLYTAVVLAVLAAGLTSYDEASMGQAATKFLGPVGGMVIVGGALFSMVSASNASIMAGSRVAMTMGQLGHLPASMGKIHPLTRTPVVSLIVVGAAILLFTVSLNLEDLAHYADTVLLLALILVNAALIAHRRRYPDMERPFRVPLVPLLPGLGIVANLYLMGQLIHHPLPMGLALGTLALGGLGFVIWQRLDPDVGGADELDDGAAEKPRSAADADPDRYRVLVPLSNPATAQALLKIASALAADRGGEIVLARVVVVPEQAPTASPDVLRRETHVLQQAEADAAALEVPMVPVVTISHDVAQAIQSVASEHHCDLVLLGWKGYSTTRERILGEITDTVVSQARCDIMVVKPVGEGALERVLLPTAGGEHAERALGYAAALSRHQGTTLTVATVVPPGGDDAAAQALVERAAAQVEGAETAVLKGESVEDAIVDAGAGYDAILIGATERHRYSGLLFGTIPENIARHSARTVMVVKRVG